MKKPLFTDVNAAYPFQPGDRLVAEYLGEFDRARIKKIQKIVNGWTDVETRCLPFSATYAFIFIPVPGKLPVAISTKSPTFSHENTINLSCKIIDLNGIDAIQYSPQRLSVSDAFWYRDLIRDWAAPTNVSIV